MEYKNGSKFLNFANFTYGYSTFDLKMGIFFMYLARENSCYVRLIKKNKKKTRIKMVQTLHLKKGEETMLSLLTDGWYTVVVTKLAESLTLSSLLNDDSTLSSLLNGSLVPKNDYGTLSPLLNHDGTLLSLLTESLVCQNDDDTLSSLLNDDGTLSSLYTVATTE